MATGWQEDFSTLKSPSLMGILNVTPDSFSDGGEHFGYDQAIAHAENMLRDGARIIDIGGESTRPGSDYVGTQEELTRVIPVMRQLKINHPQSSVSVDTRKHEVAKQAIEAGAEYINDISALRDDPQMASLLAAHPDVKVILMHMQGDPKNMQNAPHYDDLLPELMQFFSDRISYCQAEGIALNRILIDPGIGFGKNLEHNLSLISHMQHFRAFGVPIVMGVSRKRFISAIHPSEPQARLAGTLASALVLAMQRVDILRVHDVREHAQFFAVLSKLAGRD